MENKMNEEQEFTLPTLHELALIIKSKQENIDHLLMPRPHDVCMCEFCNAGRIAEQFTAIAEAMNVKITSELVNLVDKAKQIAIASDQKKIVYRGIGTFIFQKNRVTVNDTDFTDLDETEKFNQQTANPELFSIKTTYNPDKKKILEILKEGGIVDGFRLSDESHTFKFKS